MTIMSEIRSLPNLPIVSSPYKFVRTNLQVIVIAISACWLLFAGCREAPHDMRDFLPVYAGARCLLHGCNPYDTAQLDAQYFESGGSASYRPRWYQTPPVYPPSAFLVLSPLALLRIPVVLRLWSALNALLLIACVVFVRSIVPPSSRWLVTILGSCYLVSYLTTFFVGTGQPGAFAISLLIIGTLFYLRGRYMPLATVLLMLSLAVKPQMGLMIVLYFVFSRIYSRQAVCAITGSIVILLIGGLILKSRPVSAQWTSALRTQIADSEKPGEVNDPRPAVKSSIAFVNLQAITSVFVDEKKVYDALTYVIFLAGMVAWIAAIARSHSGSSGHWLALATLAALSLLPVYHRDYDTRMLILALPAVAIIFRQRRILGSIVIALTLLHIFSFPIQRRSLRALQILAEHHITAHIVPQNKLLFLLSLRQESLEVLVLAGCFLAAMFMVRVPPAASQSRA